MESDFYDRLDVSYLPSRRPRGGTRVLYALGVVALLALVFQLFFRYEYLTSAGTVLRIDRITHQVCRIVQGRTDCSPAGVAQSYSTSTSTSTSTSLYPH